MYQETWCSIRCILVTVTFATLTLASSSINAPIGISFGINEITSAYTTDDGSFVTVAIVQTSQEWKQFATLLGENGYDSKGRKYKESDVEKFLVAEIPSIEIATKVTLNRDIEITGLTCPDFFARHGFGGVLLDTVARLQPSLEHGAHAWRYFHNTRLAHNLNNAASLGYPPGTDIEDEANYLLNFDYQDSILLVAITTISVHMTLELKRFRLPDFGGNAQNASPEKLALLGKRTTALVKSVLAGDGSKYPPAELSDIRRIIFTGDASASEFEKIRTVVVEMYPDFENRFVEGIEPRWVAAVGAAKLARLFKFDHGRFVGDPGYGEGDLHDEL